MSGGGKSTQSQGDVITSDDSISTTEAMEVGVQGGNAYVANHGSSVQVGDLGIISRGLDSFDVGLGVVQTGLSDSFDLANAAFSRAQGTQAEAFSLANKASDLVGAGKITGENDKKIIIIIALASLAAIVFMRKG